MELVSKIVIAADDLRRSKHRILNELRLIFPELVSLGTKLWGKKAAAALEEGRFDYFRNYGLELNESLARFMPGDEIRQAREKLPGLFAELRQIEARERELLSEINALVRNHPIVQMFSGSDSAKRLVLLIGWRKWGSTKRDFRQLRKYAGLAVSRIDAKGNPRISRERPAIRTNLYFLLRTREGKRIIEEAEVRLDRELKKRPKRMEILLKEIWRNYLQG